MNLFLYIDCKTLAIFICILYLHKLCRWIKRFFSYLSKLQRYKRFHKCQNVNILLCDIFNLFMFHEWGPVFKEVSFTHWYDWSSHIQIINCTQNNWKYYLNSISLWLYFQIKDIKLACSSLLAQYTADSCHMPIKIK